MVRKSQSEVELAFLYRGLFLIDEYKNKETPMKAYDKDGYIAYVSYGNFIIKGQNYSTTNIKNPFALYNISLWLGKNMPHIEALNIIPEDNERYSLECLCTVCGNIIMKKFSSLRAKEGCAICARKVPLTIDSAKENIKIMNPKIKILSTKYIHANDKLLVECENGHIREQSYSSITGGSGCKICSDNRLKIDRLGEKSSAWNGGDTSIIQFLRAKLTDWKKDSMKECGYKCVITGGEFDIIHHRTGFNKIVKEVFENTGIKRYEYQSAYTDSELITLIDELNRLHYFYGLGVCLSDSVHMEFHNKYGRGDNTMEQWDEFYLSKTRGDL